MKKYYLFISLALTSILFSTVEEGCSISELLQAPKTTSLENKDESNCSEETKEEPSSKIVKMGITEKLMSVKVLHGDEELLIERKMLSDEFTCPPFCIEPMNIKEVTTVAELEVLAFIDKLKEKKARLLIDVRESKLYDKKTIPGAINLPYSMLKDESKYQEKVLTLLGGKLKGDSSWSFKNAQSLLIFGASVTSLEASSTVKKLLELGYPSSKLRYYRAGISSWKALGLTVY